MMALDPIVAVRGHISRLGHHLAGSGRLARASALLLMRSDIQTTQSNFINGASLRAYPVDADTRYI